MAELKSETKNYNSCPLKKRPVLFVNPVAVAAVAVAAAAAAATICVPEPEPEQDEPVNLCVRKVVKDEQICVGKIRATPLKEITVNHQERYRDYGNSTDIVYDARIKQESLYNLLPGYAANTTNTLNYSQQTSPSAHKNANASPMHQDSVYWPSYSREASMSPPHVYASQIKSLPSPPVTAVQTAPRYASHDDYYPSENVVKAEPHYVVNKARYVPYHVSRQHHIVDQHYSGMSPTHSHSSLNSIGSPRSSMSPASTSSSLPEELYHMMHTTSTSTSTTTITKPAAYESSQQDHSVAMKNEMPRYQCTDCSRSYATYPGLTKHKQFHCTASATSEVKKSFTCEHCPKTYNSMGALKMHIRTHTKPCKCHLCGKAFSRPWLLQGHIRTHTGDKPFSCQYCHRAFADKSNLRAHLQTHSDIKKYSCTTCSKTFSRMSLLTKHIEGGCPGVHEHSHEHDHHIQ